MTSILRKTTVATVSALLLLALSACTGGAPNMSDYSYVPASKTITVATPQGGLEDF